MAYTKQTWENVPSTNTPLSADRLNHIEDGIEDAHEGLDGKADETHTHAASAITSGTLDVARLPVGNSSSTVCAGNDSRLSDQRTPSDGSVSTAKIQDGAITNAKVATSAAIAASKLSSNVQASLSKADESVQKSGTATGMWMGTTLPGSGTAGVLYVVVP
ncbi:hypothetical protein SEA_MODRAGONS_23 [Mycobacterium phage Modragons]|nr:hypothetical protein SEA_MODRAGONS_23 [Mycobacterium phage Modragons]